MYLKSECTGANDDNFVQEGETMKELTVTITLEEYRNLIIERTRNEKYIDDLEERLKKAEAQAKIMTDMVMFDHPEFFGDVVQAVTKFLAKMQEPVSDEESDTDERAETV